ncbi:MAG: hypothetical protein ACRDD1_03805, partial [Planctomycetia bacterium]
PENISATALEKYMPEVAKEYGAIVDREFRQEQTEAGRRERELDRELRRQLAREGNQARVGAAEKKTSDATVSREDATRKEFNGLPEVQKYNVAKQSIAQMEKAAAVPENDPSRASADIAMVYNFMRLQDPTSTVREGEFATAANAGGVSESIRNMYNKVMDGEPLGPKVRQGFLTQSKRDYQAFRDNYEGVRRRYGAIASERGLNPAMIVGDDSQFAADSPPPTNTAPNPTATPAPKTRRVWKPGG